MPSQPLRPEAITNAGQEARSLQKRQRQGLPVLRTASPRQGLFYFSQPWSASWHLPRSSPRPKAHAGPIL
ncbi:hypothetical protein OOK60_05350 [Trichothermofontia sichuanensis B231]|uniref:hypothetical protein n=1 Tax=Trichothermofontia sichuanensis TaxID=3045816 RepID=UPI00224755A8|nr:hypothetical protein [Trichothermofontia sichuanensis]UZQ55501.1 hypothetical protein OOK60_05350 [Trichothermofontia sichuanensis B231]